MKTSDKVRVAVLYGGRSAEHEISLQSAKNIIENLDPTLFEVVPIGIDKEGNWSLGNEVFLQGRTCPALEDKQYTLAQNQTWFAPEWIGKPTTKRQANEWLATQSGLIFDVVFPAVHGTLCEDGALQGLLELANVPYVGSGVLASAIGMDKDIAKRLVIQAGMPVVPYFAIKKMQWQQSATYFLQRIKETFTLPIFVKPANTGSSVGVHKVKEWQALKETIDDAFRFDVKVLIETAIDAIELEIAVLEPLDQQAAPIVSVVGEIRTKHEFYTYEAKYQDENGAELLIPAAVAQSVHEQAQTMAKQIFKVLECEGMARVDLFCDKTSKKVYFNEINTLPGFTTISMYPKLMAASGMPYHTLLAHLVQLAVLRHKYKSKIIRQYEEKN